MSLSSLLIEMQSPLGLLHSIAKCVGPVRAFLNWLFGLLGANVHVAHHILVTYGFCWDLHWFCVILKSFNGVNIIMFARWTLMSIWMPLLQAWMAAMTTWYIYCRYHWNLIDMI